MSRSFKIALKAALSLLEPTWHAPERWEPRWWGYWSREGHGPMYGGTLFIRDVGTKGFFFHMWVFNGTHTGLSAAPPSSQARMLLRHIVMKGEYGELWAAYTDGESIRYFTTEREWKTKLPLTVAKWREVAPEKELIFDSGVEVTPGHFNLQPVPGTAKSR